MSPFFSDPLIEFTVASSARPAAALEMSACFAIASINSDLFTNVPFRSLMEFFWEGAAGDELRRTFIAIVNSSCQAPDRVAGDRIDAATPHDPGCVDHHVRVAQCLITAAGSSDGDVGTA